MKMKKILIVDNNPVVTKMLSSALTREGFEVREAEDGLTAFDILQSFTPDIIFLDLIMPNINGEQFSHMIVDREELENTKIVVISGVAVEARGECEVRGAHACIAKGPHLVQHVIDVAKRFTDENFQIKEHEVIGTEDIFPRETSRELLQANRHFQVVLNNMDEGILELSSDQRIIFANPAAAKIVGKSVEKLLASDFKFLFEKNDRIRITKLLQDRPKSPCQISEDDPVFLQNQQVSINFIPVEDRDNMTTMVIIQDISKRKIAEFQLRETKEYLASIFDSVQAGIVLIDEETRTIVDANPRALDFFETNKEDFVNKSCNEFFCPFLKGECPILDHGKLSCKTTQVLTNSQGKKVHILKTSTLCVINKKEYIIESFLDISEQKCLEDKLQSLAITDELTRLLNRRGFMMMARKQLKIADRGQGNLFLLFADVDNLKWINDTYGHDIGDQALIKVAEILSSFRSSDIIARLGGDEFAILVSGVTVSGGEKQLASRFNSLLEEENKKNELGFKLGLSFGVIGYDPENPCEIDELIAEADRRMYLSKKDKKKKS